ncbi:MAG: class I SAM-dependent methyltransferase [Planctomycetes bacterium]|nr:class I SAM-dependent methyltransferase [Planctomycetota bacterium]
MNATLVSPHDEVMRRLHHQSPFADFDASSHAEDLRGWHGAHPIFGELVAAVRPELTIEVGTWKGQSAVTLGTAIQALGPGRALVCVDTWLGALEFRRDFADAERYAALDLRHGYPQVYYQFLANVVKRGLEDVIVPFPQTSLIAARWFLQQGIQAELIYVDGSHEENDVYFDLVYYWQICRPGGVVFGDDLDWAGVQTAVTRFAAEQGLELRMRDGIYWLLVKPL